MLHLPPDTITHYSEAHVTGSWLDHNVVSENLRSQICNFKVLCGLASSNHFPISCDVLLDSVYSPTDDGFLAQNALNLV